MGKSRDYWHVTHGVCSQMEKSEARHEERAPGLGALTAHPHGLGLAIQYHLQLYFQWI